MIRERLFEIFVIWCLFRRIEVFPEDVAALTRSLYVGEDVTDIFCFSGLTTCGLEVCDWISGVLFGSDWDVFLRGLEVRQGR